MDVKTLCLGLLSFGDASGYDLKKRFEAFFHQFYSAGYGSIYPALAELAERDLVTCRELPREGKPYRKVYSITASGREEFLAALRTTEPQHKLRSEFLAMMYFAELMDPGRLERVLQDRLAELQNTMQQMAALSREWGNDTPVGARFIAGFGAVLAKAAADYIEQNRDQLLAAAGPAHADDTGRRARRATTPNTQVEKRT